MDLLWTVLDRLGRPVSLSQDRLDHILTNHADMSVWIASLAGAVAEADIVERDPGRMHRHRHYRLVSGPRLHIRVVVHYAPSPNGWVGTVITAHLYKREIAGERIWP
jgi:hypothetical protein